MNDYRVARILSPYIGLETTIDKVLFSIATSLTLILLIILLRFWRRRKRLVHNIQKKDADRKIKQLEQSINELEEFPTISFAKKSMTATDLSIKSDVSSMWDSQSQKFDKMFFKDTEIQIQIASSMTATENDIENGCNTLKIDPANIEVLEMDQSSTEDRVDAGVHDMKIKQLPLRNYQDTQSIKDDNMAVESRDDMIDEARSV